MQQVLAAVLHAQQAVGEQIHQLHHVQRCDAIWLQLRTNDKTQLLQNAHASFLTW